MGGRRDTYCLINMILSKMMYIVAPKDNHTYKKKAFATFVSFGMASVATKIAVGSTAQIQGARAQNLFKTCQIFATVTATLRSVTIFITINCIFSTYLPKRITKSTQNIKYDVGLLMACILY